jgi:membrane protein implicated in regulation of membrane protease activity
MYIAMMNTNHPITFAFWLAIAALSAGISLGWPYLVLLGLLGPLLVLLAAFVVPFFRRY